MTNTATAARVAVTCVRCDGTGRYHGYGACYGCGATGTVYLTPAGVKARATRARAAQVPTVTGPRVDCGYCLDTGRLVNHGPHTGKPCRHCEATA